MVSLKYNYSLNSWNNNGKKANVNAKESSENIQYMKYIILGRALFYS